MTIAFSEIKDEDRFIIRSGSGYFVRFNGSNPFMVSTPLLATRLNYYEAVGILIRFEKLGYQAEVMIEPGG